MAVPGRPPPAARHEFAWLQSRIRVCTTGPLAVGGRTACCCPGQLRDAAHCCETLFGNRPAILLSLGIFLFSPLSLGGAGWWAVVDRDPSA